MRTSNETASGGVHFASAHKSPSTDDVIINEPVCQRQVIRFFEGAGLQIIHVGKTPQFRSNAARIA